MRDVNRIKIFCGKLEDIWEEYFPDLRFGQFISNFTCWLMREKDIDIFFSEEDDMIKYIQEYANETKTWNRF